MGEQGPCNLRKYTNAHDVAQSLSTLGSLMLIPSCSKQATIASETGSFFYEACVLMSSAKFPSAPRLNQTISKSLLLVKNVSSDMVNRAIPRR